MDNVGRVYHYSGGEIPDELRSTITSIRVAPQVEDIPDGTFQGCINLAEVQFAQGGALQLIGDNAFKGCTALKQVSIPPSVTTLGSGAFEGCSNLTDVQFANEGALKVIGVRAFYFVLLYSKLGMTRNSLTQKHNRRRAYLSNPSKAVPPTAAKNAARKITSLPPKVSIPPSVTELGSTAFGGCVRLTNVQFANGGALEVGDLAFAFCTDLQQVSIPPSVTELGWRAFKSCSNLTEVTLLGTGYLAKGFIGRILLGGEAALNKTRIKHLFGPVLRAFPSCPLATIKIQISRELSQCMARLPEECRRSVKGRIHDMHRLELAQDGNVFACFPVIRRSTDDMNVQDTNDQTAASLNRVLRLISFHELKESSILTELAVWKSRIDEAETPVPPEERHEYRVSIPDPAKCLIMEYCGFTDFLEPAIEGN
ncbi:hypothetical protein THAOC_03716 [Thalassiosira oceanica]|uniref:Leucine-rich repeat domain-containing protein n=1 Tax=Thalassiosira oceanica TaxID=159749 RepID=K0TKI4_THAOC|nr:hypothetical protein THAOC_03716 [Thalassiosira oceanica]|eukprot:EJK74596.1 hypothetical protein THAOC_03716 [Thalassiosira oceanica]